MVSLLKQKATNFNSVISPWGLLPADKKVLVRLYIKRCKSNFNDFSMGSLDEPGAIHVVVIFLWKSIGCDFPIRLSKGYVTV
jgi:hypothetical protein